MSYCPQHGASTSSLHGLQQHGLPVSRLPSHGQWQAQSTRGSARECIAAPLPAAHRSTWPQPSHLSTHTQPSTAAQVELESVSGDMDMHFLNADLTNAYRNLSNIVLGAGARCGGRRARAAPGRPLRQHAGHAGCVSFWRRAHPATLQLHTFHAFTSLPGGECSVRCSVHGMRMQAHRESVSSGHEPICAEA